MRLHPLEVDDGMTKEVRRRQWEYMKWNFDQSSTTHLAHVLFTFEDLVAYDRKLLYMTIVTMQKPNSIKRINVNLLVFDDILVLVREKDETFSFLQDVVLEAVFPLEHTILREEATDLKAFMIIVHTSVHSDMIVCWVAQKSKVSPRLLET